MSTLVALAFFVVPLVAGSLVRLLRPDAGWLKLLLSFSGSFLLGVVFLHMLPELYAAEGEHIGLWVLAGFLLQVVLEFYSRGIEHGHMHGTSGHLLPLVTLLSLCIHSFIEGIPFADPGVAGDLAFLVGVLLHKMPMAIALSSVLLRAGSARGRSWALLTVFASAAPTGILVGHLIGQGVGIVFLHNMLAVAIGMLLHIGTTIIFESAPEHRIDRARFGAVLAGAALAILSMH